MLLVRQPDGRSGRCLVTKVGKALFEGCFRPAAERFGAVTGDARRRIKLHVPFVEQHQAGFAW